MSSDLDRVTGAEYLGDLETRSIEDIREMRAECQEIETGLSYVRRLIQARFDLVATEAKRRERGDSTQTLEALIAELPGILAEHTRTPGVGRLPQTLGTGRVDPDLESEVDAVLTPSGIAGMTQLSDEILDEKARALADLERRVSDRRRVMFDQLDALQAEIARRYRTGEADVESLLK